MQAARLNGKAQFARKETHLMKRAAAFLLAGIAAITLAAVPVSAGEKKASEKEKSEKKGESKMQRLPSGLQYEDVKAGDGAQPKTGQTCVMHYTGWLWVNGAKGAKFDSSVDRGKPFEFPLGQGAVIKGWDEGVATMKVGGKRNLLIPPALGYGARGAGGVIPPNATLLFEVELLGVK
jgi:peptidylprolyl isomerase